MWLSAQKIISFCNFPAQEFECMVCCPIGNMTSCASCIGYHLNIINITVETNYEAYNKMKLQNEWGTFIDLKVLPVSYLFLWCPPQYLGDPIRRNGGIHAISCKIRNIRNTQETWDQISFNRPLARNVDSWPHNDQITLRPKRCDGSGIFSF